LAFPKSLTGSVWVTITVTVMVTVFSSRHLFSFFKSAGGFIGLIWSGMRSAFNGAWTGCPKVDWDGQLYQGKAGFFCYGMHG